MNENVEIALSSNIDTKGLDLLRKALNDQRNELNAVARETDKADIKYKQLKATVSELNRIMKLSDTELKQYASSLIPVEKNIDNVNNAKGRLLTNTDKLTKSFSSLKTNVGSYSTTLVNLSSDIATGDKTIMQSIGTLGLYAGGWAAVASAIFLATSNLVDYLNTNTEEIKTFEKKSDKVFGSDVLGGRDGSLDYLNKKTEGGMFFTPEEQKATEKELRTLKEIEAERSKISTPKNNAGKTQATEKLVTLTNELIDKQNELNKLLEKESTFTADQKNQIVYLNYLESVKKLKSDIAGLQLSQDTLKVNGIPMGNDLAGRLPIDQIAQTKSLTSIDEKLRQAKFAESANKTLSDTQTLYGVISQTMSLIGITTDSFLGKLVSGFGTVLTIMESIKTVNSILSFIPGFADGGIMPGVSWVGERGKELMFNPGAYVMNHSDSMKFMNSNSSGSNVNVYLSGNIDVKAQLRKENKKYRAITIKQ